MRTVSLPPCRLCGGTTVEAFQATVLSKNQIGYFHCESCGSLQTESPYWLADAYSGHNLAAADTGAVLRTLYCQAIIYAVARILNFNRSATILDFGGGNGLLCRLLRDCGFEARVSDVHAVNDFARGFDDDGGPFDIVCAFEVAEHFANPREDMKKLFRRDTRLCVIGTVAYRGQGADWSYLARDAGQHVFFYSPKGMAMLAAELGYRYLQIGDVNLFLNRPFSRREVAMLNCLLNPRRLKWVRAYLTLRATFDFATRDASRFTGA